MNDFVMFCLRKVRKMDQNNYHLTGSFTVVFSILTNLCDVYLAFVIPVQNVVKI